MAYPHQDIARLQEIQRHDETQFKAKDAALDTRIDEITRLFSSSIGQLRRDLMKETSDRMNEGLRSDRRFEKIEARLDSIEARLTKIEGKIPW
jgi:DnaJ-domain-containing protein 1